MTGDVSVATSTIALVEPWLRGDESDAVAAQVQSGFLGPGKRTAEFADALAERVGARRVVLTTSGTVALSVAAIVLGLAPGDEILVPAYGVISTINAFASIGLRPSLVDIDAPSGCMSARALEAAIRPETRAVCFVNFSGNTGPQLLDVLEVCRQHNLPLIEDAAGALGHTFQGRYAGTIGTVGTYSFSVPKVLTTGQGGALVFNDEALAMRASEWIDHGDPDWRRTNLNRAIGTNMRFNDVQAALGLSQFRSLDERLERKRKSHAVLREQLGPFLWSVSSSEAPLHNIVFTRDTEGLMSSLQARGIQTARPYRTISDHPAYAELREQSNPTADWWTAHAVYLPFGVALTEQDALRVAQAVRESGVQLELVM